MRRPAYRKSLPKPRTDRIRETILTVAARHFAKHGFAGASVEQVILECGIGKDTFYRRFSSKLALFEAMGLRERQRIDGLFEAFSAQSQGSAIERLTDAARWLLEINLAPDMIALKRIAFSEARLFGQTMQNAPSPIVDYLVGLVRELQSEGSFEAADPAEIVGFMINALVLGPMNAAMLAEEPLHDASWRASYFERTWPRIVKGLKA